jgi:3-hydroxyacyl-CoA dehydrogenase/enoyl-CoA hydratase/3-hydroxybutyryl-CoA epimerase
MIFGTGFAPFRGGPMHYMEHRGRQVIVDRLKELEGQYGERFAADAGWKTVS